jgi:hypothetical protein
MIIVVAYGAYSLLSESGENKIVDTSKKSLAELKKFVIDAATSLSSEYISAADKYIIEQAEKTWPQDPFLKTGALLTTEPFEAKVEVTVDKVRLSYTGFIQTSDTQLAIVNGTEYEPGEQINEAGYYIKKILPNKVVLGIENNPDNIILPLDEPVNIALETNE